MVVLHTIQWLVRNNKYYCNITISAEADAYSLVCRITDLLLAKLSKSGRLTGRRQKIAKMKVFMHIMTTFIQVLL